MRDALDILRARGEIDASEDAQVVVLTGDGSAYGKRLSATSGATDRELYLIYRCCDNEGYGNTGQQFSPATPHAARTATSSGSLGYPGFKKDLFSIWTAHDPTYAATVIGCEPLDLARKLEKASKLSGPRLILSLAPCPTGWGYEPMDSVEIGRLAVETGVWPLKEYVDGRLVHTKVLRKRAPIEQYLERQGRFAHLFEPRRQDEVLADIQARIDGYWAAFEEGQG